MHLQELIDVVAQYRVLVVGDGIIDEYCYVKPLNKSPKENIIVNRYLRSEVFRGGVWAAARHVANFCREVVIYSGQRTILKRRFVDETGVRKMYEIHVQAENAQPSGEFPELQEFDLVIVVDFGHGCITPAIIERLGSARFLAVNAQTNAANYGFNLVTKYPSADLVVLDQLEARLAVRDPDSSLEDVIRKLNYKRVIITCGPQGAIGYDDSDCVFSASAMPGEVIDTMGAGDAFLAVCAPFAAAGAGMFQLLAIGNIAGALKCAVVGHREAVTREKLMRALSA